MILYTLLFLIVSNFYTTVLERQNFEEDCECSDPKNQLCLPKKCHEEKGLESVFEIDPNNWQQLLYGKWLVLLCLPLRPDCRDLEGALYELANSTQKFINVYLAYGDLSKHRILNRRFSISDLPAIFHIKDGEFRLLDPIQDKTTLMAILHNFDLVNIEVVAPWETPTSIFVELSVLVYEVGEDLREVNIFGQNFNCAEWLSKFILFTLVISIFWLTFILIDYIKKKKRAPVYDIPDGNLSQLFEGSSKNHSSVKDLTNKVVMVASPSDEDFKPLFKESIGDHSSVEDLTSRVVMEDTPSDENYWPFFKENIAEQISVQDLTNEVVMEATPSDENSLPLFEDNIGDHSSLEDLTNSDVTVCSSADEDFLNDELSVESSSVEPPYFDFKFDADTSSNPPSTQDIYSQTSNEAHELEYHEDLNDNSELDSNLCSKIDEELSSDCNSNNVSYEDGEKETQNFTRSFINFEEKAECTSREISEAKENLYPRSFSLLNNAEKETSLTNDTLKNETDLEADLFKRALDAYDMDNVSLSRNSSNDDFQHSNVEDKRTGLCKLEDDNEEENCDGINSDGDITIKRPQDYDNSEEKGSEAFGVLEILDNGQYYRYSTTRNSEYFKVVGQNFKYTEFKECQTIDYDSDTVFVDPEENALGYDMLWDTCVGRTMLE
ncbi:uncharacterized protein [Drosophila bipectinata]|uniref:uncharacterized protein n=1 Tax=Drosophila bipectinata TaxID=42026 RepID=UPI0038B38008